MARALAVIALAAALLTAAVPASARTVTGVEGLGDAEFWRLVDGGLVHADYDAHDGPYELDFHTAKGTVRELDQLDRAGRLTPKRLSGADGVAREMWFDAAGDRVAMMVETYHFFDEGADGTYAPAVTELWTATLTGAPQRLRRCAKGGLGPPSVDGDRVAYLGATCDREQTALEIVDLGAGGSRSQIAAPEGHGFGGVQLAGDYVAGYAYPLDETGPEQIVVYERATGREAYRVSRHAIDWDLQADGKLVATHGTRHDPDATCDADEVAWYSPAEPAEHVLPLAACGDRVEMARDRILRTRRLRDERAPGQIGRDEGAPLVTHDTVITDLAGETLQPVFPAFTGFYHEAPQKPIDYDGERIAYITPTCTREVAVIDPVAELGANGPPRFPSCKVSLGRVPSSVRLDRAGDAPFELVCPRGCMGGQVRLWLPSAKRYLRTDPGEQDFVGLGDVKRGRAIRVRFDLAPPERKLVRSRRALKVELHVELRQPNGVPRTFKRAVTLRPR